MFLYFPGTMCQEEASQQQLQDNTWQFAMKLPVPDARVSVEGKVQKPRHGFRCLACGWTSLGTLSITSMCYHIMHSQKCKGKACPKVTQDMLDRLKAVDD